MLMHAINSAVLWSNDNKDILIVIVILNGEERGWETSAARKRRKYWDHLNGIMNLYNAWLVVQHLAVLLPDSVIKCFVRSK